MARTEEQNEQMRKARREKIRIEALHQFSRKGLYSTRIQDIVEGAGMSQGLLYHYYPSKKAIFLDMISDALYKTNQAALSVKNMDVPAKEKVLYSLSELFKTIETNDRFRQGQKEGSIVDGDPDELATLYWTSVNGLSIYYATLKKPLPVPDSKLLAAMFLKDINCK